MLEYWDDNLFRVFKKKKDVAVVDALLYLMKNTKTLKTLTKNLIHINS